MNIVHLIVTGDMENKGLADALSRIKAFKEINFTIQQTKGITSSKIPNDFSLTKGSERPRDVDKLASAMLSNVVKNKDIKSQLADMVIVIDDLELANVDQPKKVLDFFGDALRSEIMKEFSSQKVQERYFKKVKNICSFHFLVPMAEAYFFGEIPSALERAGATIQSKVDGSKMDVENFWVCGGHLHNGVDYFDAPAGKKPFWTRSPKLRPQHPKKYIDFLCCPETKYTKDNKDKFYKESKGGTNALKTLNWQKVLSNQEYTQYLRALIHDIADKFEIDPPPFPGKCAPLTEYTGQGTILRNF
ncbi:hypothetical protein BGP_1868 [Beggiatoa sp. PS]|nr:hypothetical protein BGP_1868 [Beggiatoa sp. PS]